MKASRLLEVAAPIGLMLVWLAPFGLLAVGSLLELNASRPGSFWQWVGFQHYADVVASRAFWLAVGRSAILTFSAFAVSAPIGALVGWALLGLPGVMARWALAVVMLPLFLPPVTSALAWYFQLNPQYGPTGYLVYTITGRVPLDRATALAAIALVEAWRLIPVFVVVSFLLGRSLETSLKESIAVYRIANSASVAVLIARRFRSAIVLVALIALAMVSRSFESVFLITGGGPGVATETFPMYLHRLAFQRFQLGEAAAMGVIYDLFLIVAFARLGRLVNSS